LAPSSRKREPLRAVDVTLLLMERKAPGQPVTGDEVRDVRFPEGSGYDRSEVDDLLNRIAAEIDAGRPAGPLVQNALFRKGSRRAGYNWRAVDLFLEQLLAAERGLQEIGRDFGQQPGTRLSLVRTGIGRRELRTAEQQTTVVSVRDNWLGWGMGMTLSAGGKTFTWKLVPASSWPGIAGTISSYRPGEPGHMWLYYGQADRADKKDPGLRQLLDETGTPILFTGGITSGQADGYIKFPGHRWLRFPVQGRRRADAIMTAVDQAGNEVARYRLHGRTVPITVHQKLTDELTLAIALSAPWLRSRFDKGQ
jgi:DivIVA domain-containing protein